jgi:rhodanese-related sulfurtransferase
MIIVLSATGTKSISKEKKRPLHNYPQVPRISAWKAKALHDQGKLILIALQKPERYAVEHIIGAINLPPEMKQNVRLPTSVIIAFFCP